MTGRISWKEMADAASRVVNVLRSRGVKKGDRVFIQVGRLPEWWETMLACLKMGAVAMPGTVMLTPKDIGYRMELSEPAAVVTEASIAPRFAEARGKPSSVKAYLAIGGQPDGWLDFRAERDRAAADAPAEPTLATDPALLYFTSGTTGFAKMVLHTQASYGIGHVATASYWLDLAPEDLHWNISDTGWAKAAWSSFFSPFIAGAAQLVHNPTGAFSGKRVLDILAQYPITSVCGAPTIFRAVVLEDLRKWSFPSLRSCVAAGEPLNPEVIATWKAATGLEIRDGYGQTETCCLVGNYKGLDDQARVDGEALAGLRHRHRRRRREPGGRGQGGRHRRADQAGAAGRPLPRVLEERPGEPELRARRLLPHRRPRRDGRGRLRLVRRAGPTTSSSAPATASARSRWRARSSSTRRSPSPPSSRAPTTSAGRS